MSGHIVITLHVDAAAAVRAKHCAAGPQRVELDAETIAAMSDIERETLALHLERRPGWGEPLHVGCEPLAVADVPTVLACLRARAQAMRVAVAIGRNPVVYLRGDRVGGEPPP